MSLDDNMMDAYKQGKDLYATIASGIYKNKYWDNMEHHEDGSANPQGKKRRSNTKSVLLGLMYGRGAASIAEQINESYQEAQKIIDDFYKGFPKVKKWMDDVIEKARRNGYVEDFRGRRRRLPDIQLPKYTIIDKNESKDSDINPLLFCKGLVKKNENQLISKYKIELSNARGWQQVRKIKEDAERNKIEIRDNGAFISQAERQSINSIIQGGAATQSKMAMIQVYKNKELHDLGFRILLQVHDELIGECPKENAEKVSELLSDIMRHSAEPYLTIPFKTDTEITDVWYETDYFNGLHQEYLHKINDGIDESAALKNIFDEHTEIVRTEKNEKWIINGKED